MFLLTIADNHAFVSGNKQRYDTFYAATQAVFGRPGFRYATFDEAKGRATGTFLEQGATKYFLIVRTSRKR